MADVKFPQGEEWLEFPEDSTYLVSTEGRVYDLKRKTILTYSQSVTFRDVPTYSLRNSRPSMSRSPSSNRYIGAALVVLKTYVGEGEGVVYADGDKTNVCLSNLRWDKQKVGVRR